MEAPRHQRGPNPFCTCGSCKTCLLNARWERIYHEKFEDPEYYQARPVSIASPLAGLEPPDLSGLEDIGRTQSGLWRRILEGAARDGEALRSQTSHDS